MNDSIFSKHFCHICEPDFSGERIKLCTLHGSSIEMFDILRRLVDGIHIARRTGSTDKLEDELLLAEGLIDRLWMVKKI